MKIANIIYDLDKGGAAIAVSRINSCLNQNKKISLIVSYKKQILNKNFSLFIRYKNYLNLYINKLFKKIFVYVFKLKFSNTVNFNYFDSPLLKRINESDFNIVNLHWIGNDTLSIEDIGKINKKVIITLHDMWAYTSIEHYIDEKTYLDYYVRNSRKLNFFLNVIFKKKIKNFKNISHVICASKWQKRMVDKSPIFKHSKKIIIPLPLNFNLWKPIEKNLAKKKLNVEKKGFIIFLPLSNRYAARRKGLDLTIKALERIKNIKICLITTNTEKIIFQNKNIIHKNIHNPSKPFELKTIYSATDLFAMPSRYESFGQTLLEAQACKCPAIVFKNTGCEDMIQHKENGYIAKYINVQDLEAGIKWCIKKFNKKNTHFIRKQAKINYSEKAIYQKYIKILEQI